MYEDSEEIPLKSDNLKDLSFLLVYILILFSFLTCSKYNETLREQKTNSILDE